MTSPGMTGGAHEWSTAEAVPRFEPEGAHMGKEMNRVPAGGAPTLAKIDGLIEWVIKAPAEEVCWRITEVGSIREWLKAQKESTNLRVRAVRLELIALRKVAGGGLSGKIAGAPQLRAAARWLASLTDAEFDVVLSEVDAEKSPIALYLADKRQRDAMRDALRDDDGQSDWEARTYQGEYDQSPKVEKFRAEQRRRAATILLDELIEDGQPFTVAEAAESLADRLGLGIEARSNTAEGLREMVRTAIRKGGRTVPVDEWSVVPAVFTVQRADGAYERVPATRATLGHFYAHVHEIKARASEAMQHAEELHRALSKMAWELAGDGDPDLIEPEHMGMSLADVIRRCRGMAALGRRDYEARAAAVL